MIRFGGGINCLSLSIKFSYVFKSFRAICPDVEGNLFPPREY